MVLHAQYVVLLRYFQGSHQFGHYPWSQIHFLPPPLKWTLICISYIRCFSCSDFRYSSLFYIELSIKGPILKMYLFEWVLPENCHNFVYTRILLLHPMSKLLGSRDHYTSWIFSRVSGIP